MNRFILLGLSALALAACSKPAPTDPAAPAAPSPPPSASTPATPAAPAVAPGTGTTEAQGPSFDCDKAASDAETMICADPKLSALDRQLAALYKTLQTSPDELDIAAEQRGWVKGRNACWQAVDANRCLVESYQTRIVELRLAAATGPAPTAVQYRCDDASKPLSVVFHNEVDPQAAVIRLGRDQAIAFAAPSASGSRYTREGVEFWEHQGEATLAFYGTRLSCKVGS
ncbi:MliC family protein [Stenotrophomonas sp.]|uniref:MliC family protein n=1 Tax=Stenotrophomonas sp. TaxID=69392 RepID=UPI0028AED196|nr:MliC family protein [Stenotrophomonas sp.]